MLVDLYETSLFRSGLLHLFWELWKHRESTSKIVAKLLSCYGSRRPLASKSLFRSFTFTAEGEGLTLSPSTQLFASREVWLTSGPVKLQPRGGSCPHCQTAEIFGGAFCARHHVCCWDSGRGSWDVQKTTSQVKILSKTWYGVFLRIIWVLLFFDSLTDTVWYDGVVQYDVLIVMRPD